LLNLYEQESDKQAVSLFLNWFRQLAFYGKVSPEDYVKLDIVYRTKEEVRTMLVATLEQERQKIYRKGQAEGEAAGLAKGVEAQRQTLLQFIHWRFQTSEEEQTQVAQQLAQIQNLQQLAELSQLFLQMATLDEFTKWVATYLPSHNPQ
jgi:hypothetical protein